MNRDISMHQYVSLKDTNVCTSRCLRRPPAAPSRGPSTRVCSAGTWLHTSSGETGETATQRTSTQQAGRLDFAYYFSLIFCLIQFYEKRHEHNYYGYGEHSINKSIIIMIIIMIIVIIIMTDWPTYDERQMR